MKLVDHLTARLSGAFILILLIWASIYFFVQMREIYDGIDEGLNNLKQEFIYKANRTPNFVSDMAKYNPLNIIVEKISYEEAVNFKEDYAATKVYFVTEEEEEEVRMLTTAFFCEQDQQYYRLKIFTSTVESDDLIKNILYLQIVLWICMALAMFFVSKKIINKNGKPFYKLLTNLEQFRLDNTKMIDFEPSNITEYQALNDSVKNLLEENIKAFTEQKNFIENASHETQTPLAIAINKLELLMNSSHLNQEQIEEMNSVLNSLNRLKRLNSSLLLLSKIRNKQFPYNESINLTTVFEEVLDNFRDLIEHKGITVNIEKNAQSVVEINKDLAYILVNNLVKNAVAHNVKNGNIFITFNSHSITMSNDGPAIPGNVDIFERYISTSDNSGSSGLGLSIVKSIVNIYNFSITHQYKGQHVITLKLS